MTSEEHVALGAFGIVLLAVLAAQGFAMRDFAREASVRSLEERIAALEASVRLVEEQLEGCSASLGDWERWRVAQRGGFAAGEYWRGHADGRLTAPAP